MRASVPVWVKASTTRQSGCPGHARGEEPGGPPWWPRRRLTGCGTAQLRGDVAGTPAASGSLRATTSSAGIVGGALFRRDQPRLGRRSDEREQVEHTGRSRTHTGLSTLKGTSLTPSTAQPSAVCLMAIPGAVGPAGGVLLTATDLESMPSQSVGQWWTSARRSGADLHCRPGDGRALTRRSLAGVIGPGSPRRLSQRRGFADSTS